jgi:transposase
VEDAAVPAVPGARRRDPIATRRLWAERLERFGRATQTVAAFCAAEGVSVPSFYVWKRTLAGDTASPDPVQPTLVPIRLTASLAGPPIEVVFPSGTVVRFPPDARPDVIAAVVHAVGGRPC